VETEPNDDIEKDSDFFDWMSPNTGDSTESEVENYLKDPHTELFIKIQHVVAKLGHNRASL
jgi:hypothetical protein